MEKYLCPCCGYKTIDNDGHYDICPICFWEDDPIQKMDEYYEGGANKVSLVEAQKNYIKFWACEKDYIKNVRKPTKDDKREHKWSPINDNMHELNLAFRKYIDGTINIAELVNDISGISFPKDVADLVKKTIEELELIRFCSFEYKQKDEALDVIKKLIDKLNLSVDIDY